MKGTMLVIKTDGSTERADWPEPPPLEELQKAVGDSIELVPYWNDIVWDAVLRPCIAYCSSSGKLKGFARNEHAQRLWQISFGRQIHEDHLVGDIVVLFGDEEWMREL